MLRCQIKIRWTVTYKKIFFFQNCLNCILCRNDNLLINKVYIENVTCFELSDFVSNRRANLVQNVDLPWSSVIFGPLYNTVSGVR